MKLHNWFACVSIGTFVCDRAVVFTTQCPENFRPVVGTLLEAAARGIGDPDGYWDCRQPFGRRDLAQEEIET
jgi:hypothetical protein